MSGRQTVAIIMASVVLMGIVMGCQGIPAGTSRMAMAATTRLQASGAGIVKADAQKTTVRIRCGLCGFESAEITVDTPAPGKPAVLKWVCPRCGHKQTVTIQVVAAP